jgi:hypothetical protein
MGAILRALAFLSTVPFLSAADGPIPAEERQALIDLYNSTGGNNWTDHSGWLGPPGTECQWHGVACAPITLHADDSAIFFNSRCRNATPDDRTTYCEKGEITFGLPGWTGFGGVLTLHFAPRPGLYGRQVLAGLPLAVRSRRYGGGRMLPDSNAEAVSCRVEVIVRRSRRGVGGCTDA